MNEECLKEILASCSKYDLGFSDSTDSVPKIIEISVPSLCDSDIEQNVMQQVSTTNNLFLTKALESFIASETNNGSDNVDARSSSATQCTECRKDTEAYVSFEHSTKSEMVLPWRKIFECAVSKILELKFSGASKLVKDILIREYKLESQLKLMRSVYMMETSHVMNKFCKLIFTEVSLKKKKKKKKICNFSR